MKHLFIMLFAILGFAGNYNRLKATNSFIGILNATYCFDAIEEGSGTANEQALIEKINKTFDEKLKAYSVGKITDEQLKSAIKDLNEKSDGLLTEKVNSINDILVKQGEIIAGLKNQLTITNKKSLSKAERLESLITDFLGTKTFSNVISEQGGTTKKVREGSEDLQEKTVDITSDYSGTVYITERSGNVIDVANRDVNVRDLLLVSPTNSSSIAGQEIYSWSDKYTGSADVVAENGTASEGSFKVRENTWSVKRIAAFVDVSKTMLKVDALTWLRSKLISVLPKKLKHKEDTQLMFGDGAGNNVKGIMNDAQTIDLSARTITAGDISSVASYNGGAQALITFAAAHGIKNGDSMTIANATASGYNTTYTSVIVISETEVIVTVTYVAEADTSAWSGSAVNPFADAIDGAQEFDVLRVAAAYGTYFDRKINAFICNPNDTAKIDLLKGTDLQYVGVQRDAQGILRVMGLPVIETTAMPSGKFLCGDFQAENIELAELTALSIRVMEDVSYAKANKVAFIVEEEIIFPIYNKLAFFQGNFATLKTALETP